MNRPPLEVSDVSNECSSGIGYTIQVPLRKLKISHLAAGYAISRDQRCAAKLRPLTVMATSAGILTADIAEKCREKGASIRAATVASGMSGRHCR